MSDRQRSQSVEVGGVEGGDAGFWLQADTVDALRGAGSQDQGIAEQTGQHRRCPLKGLCRLFGHLFQLL